MKFLISEKLSQHKYKTPEGYLVCIDAILARTGKQSYRRSEVFADGDDEIIEIDRLPEEVFSAQTLASFENKPITVEHPDEDVNSENYKEYAVGFVRDVHRGVVDGQEVILGTLVITDAQTIEEIENGEHTDLSCGYDCDIVDEANPQQRNIRGNHVALCAEGRAGNARIVDSKKVKDETKKKAIDYYGNNGLLNFTEMSETDAENLAKQKSINSPSRIFWVAYNDVMNPISGIYWKNGKSYNEFKRALNDNSIHDDKNTKVVFVNNRTKIVQVGTQGRTYAQKVGEQWYIMRQGRTLFRADNELDAYNNVRAAADINDSIKDEISLTNGQIQDLKNYARKYEYDWQEIMDGLNSRIKKEHMTIVEAIEDIKESMVENKSLYDSKCKDSIVLLTHYKSYDIYQDENSKELYINLTKSGKKLGRLNTTDLEKAKKEIDNRLEFLNDSIKDSNSANINKVLNMSFDEFTNNYKKEIELPRDSKGIIVSFFPCSYGGVIQIFDKNDDTIFHIQDIDNKAIWENTKQRLRNKNIGDSTIKDVNPREGETKEEFISRFMSETKEEYPDEKQRFAVANSYWEKKDMKDVNAKQYVVYDVYDGEAHKELLGFCDTIQQVNKLCNERYDETDGECRLAYGKWDGSKWVMKYIFSLPVRDRTFKDATTYKINFRHVDENITNSYRVSANSVREAIEIFAKDIASEGIGTANINVINISPNDGYMRLYGKLSDLLKSKDITDGKSCKDTKDALNFDRIAECDFCGEKTNVAITHYGTGHYNRLICKECAKELKVEDSSCKDNEFNVGEKVKHLAQNTTGIIEKIYPNGNIFVKWSDYIVYSDGSRAIASEIDPKITRIQKVNDSQSCKDAEDIIVEKIPYKNNKYSVLQFTYNGDTRFIVVSNDNYRGEKIYKGGGEIEYSLESAKKTADYNAKVFTDSKMKDAVLTPADKQMIDDVMSTVKIKTLSNILDALNEQIPGFVGSYGQCVIDYINSKGIKDSKMKDSSVWLDFDEDICSKEKYKQIASKYGLNVLQFKVNSALVNGSKEGLKQFITSSFYGGDLDDWKEIYEPEIKDSKMYEIKWKSGKDSYKSTLSGKGLNDAINKFKDSLKSRGLKSGSVEIKSIKFNDSIVELNSKLDNVIAKDLDKHIKSIVLTKITKDSKVKDAEMYVILSHDGKKYISWNGGWTTNNNDIHVFKNKRDAIDYAIDIGLYAFKVKTMKI